MPQVQGPRKQTQGLQDPIITLNAATFINTKVAPTVYQHAEQGTLWIQPRNTAGTFVGGAYLNVGNNNGQAQWLDLVAAGGAGVFSSLTVNPGPIDLTGTLTQLGTAHINISGAFNTVIGGVTNTGTVGIGNINSGGVTILAPSVQVDSTAAGDIKIGHSITSGTIEIGDALTTGTLIIGNHASTNTVNLESGSGGLNVISGGLFKVDFLSDIVASPTTTAVVNGRQVYATFTGFTTAAAGSQVFTITDSFIAAGSSLLVTVNNLGSNDAQMTLTRVLPGAGTVDITCQNLGAASLNGDVNITMWVMD